MDDPTLGFGWDMLVTVLFSFAIFYWAMQVCLPKEKIEEMMEEVVLPEEEGLDAPAHLPRRVTRPRHDRRTAPLSAWWRSGPRRPGPPAPRQRRTGRR